MEADTLISELALILKRFGRNIGVVDDDLQVHVMNDDGKLEKACGLELYIEIEKGDAKI